LRATAPKQSAYFGAVPFRALADRGLTELDVRILGVVAAHDNMSLLRGGDGCWAGTDRIAYLANANASNVSTAITKLDRLGYIRRDRHPKDGRRSTLRVIYDALADKAAFKGDVSPEGKILAMKRQARLSPDTLPDPVKVSCPEISETRREQRDLQSNIPEYTLNRPSGESAPPNVGGWLARLERKLKGIGIAPHERQVYAGWLRDIVDSTELTDPNNGRAQRLLEAVDN
jgi:hypothetical protein